MATQLPQPQGRYAGLLSLHRFILQAGVAANIVTHNLLLTTYMDCRKTDAAMEHYKILIKGLVDSKKSKRAMESKVEMLSKGLYSYLMSRPSQYFESRRDI
ncbi:hypothetical protein M9H77_36303 [Catharanthus roseus]|uniref:Uncharacterized protein n=1 Tax=Catharanthus roseus TaxID=4058 RepID=A0ACB9ZRT5_CATRO|nr:hypothetical protein M9H77_36303 [Catharanthus roseus]